MLTKFINNIDLIILLSVNLRVKNGLLFIEIKDYYIRFIDKLKSGLLLNGWCNEKMYV
jgi:hypothetical protein